MDPFECLKYSFQALKAQDNLVVLTRLSWLCRKPVKEGGNIAPAGCHVWVREIMLSPSLLAT